jgi:hydrogenase/urease accessory protein HupE
VILRGFVTLLFVVFWVGPALADDLRPGYLEIRETPPAKAGAYSYAITWKAPIKPGLAARVEPNFPADCTISGAQKRSIEAQILLVHSNIGCDRPLAGRTIRLDGIEGTAGDALLRYQALDGEIQAARLTPYEPATTIVAKAGRWQVARTYFLTGVEHIVMGYDHLLFVLSLVLLLTGAWRVAATVTAFTIAHSLTLIATTLQLVSVPRAPVEAAIALSIVFLAVEIVKRKPARRRLSERVPWSVAFLFGLLHGFGFAGALAEIGLPKGEVPTALLTFNLGVETGQLIIVATAMAALSILKRVRAPWLKPAETAAAYAIGTVSAMWLIERVFI